MAKFTSTIKTNALIVEHAMSAFNLECFEQVNIKSESWGVSVEVLNGEHSGIYDYFHEDKSFISA